MLELSDRKWAEFKVSDIFTVTGSKTTAKTSLDEIGAGSFPYVTTQATNNSVAGFYNYYTEDGNVIIAESAVAGFVSYQEMPFSASGHVEKLVPKFNMTRHIGLFIVTVLRQATNGKYNYGYKFNQQRIRETVILLPINSQDQPDYDFMEQYIAERERL